MRKEIWAIGLVVLTLGALALANHFQPHIQLRRAVAEEISVLRRVASEKAAAPLLARVDGLLARNAILKVEAVLEDGTPVFNQEFNRKQFLDFLRENFAGITDFGIDASARHLRRGKQGVAQVELVTEGWVNIGTQRYLYDNQCQSFFPESRVFSHQPMKFTRLECRLRLRPK